MMSLSAIVQRTVNFNAKIFRFSLSIYLHVIFVFFTLTNKVTSLYL